MRVITYNGAQWMTFRYPWSSRKTVLVYRDDVPLGPNHTYRFVKFEYRVPVLEGTVRPS